jgi:hypothetical protein
MLRIIHTPLTGGNPMSADDDIVQMMTWQREIQETKTMRSPLTRCPNVPLSIPGHRFVKTTRRAGYGKHMGPACSIAHARRYLKVLPTVEYEYNHAAID